MAYEPIKYKGKTLTLHKSKIAPKIGGKTILANSVWEYVALWLKREHQEKALFNWQQAEHFYKASKLLPKTSAPLPLYYCFLNASKALLLVKNISFSDRHGITGNKKEGKVSLINEIVVFKGGGILPELCKYFEESAQRETYSLKELLYNLPYLHRAYMLTYTSQKELFIPLFNPMFVRKCRSKEAWFCAELKGKDATGNVISKLPAGFEKDQGVTDKFIIRRKKRFKWNGRQQKNIVESLKKYHKKIRQHAYYINGNQRLWYLKRTGGFTDYIRRTSTTITFATMHRLSELARYSPENLAKHLDSSHNWLFSEFIDLAAEQFVDEIASEITGKEFLPTAINSSKNF
jgi:uncharacterized protein (UPF0332 family)